MSSKYGDPLTPPGWKGWRLRRGLFPARGAMGGLVAAEDAVLVWSGGRSRVTLQGRADGERVERRFVRHGGMVDFLPRGTAFDEISWTGQPSECVSVAFDASSIAQLLGKEAILAPGSLRTAVADAHVVDLAQRLIEQSRTGQPLGALYVEALSLALASYVDAKYGTPVRGDETPSIPARDAQRLSEFVEDHLEGSISLTQMADLVGYSPDHFARIFKRTFGCSPYQYVIDRRVERAKRLLRQNVLSIAEVALACGFTSQSHLHTAFKARTGVTPGVFRKH